MKPRVFRLIRCYRQGQRGLMGVDAQGRILGKTDLPGPRTSLRWFGLADEQEEVWFTRQTGIEIDKDCQ